MTDLDGLEITPGELKHWSGINENLLYRPGTAKKLIGEGLKTLVIAGLLLISYWIWSLIFPELALIFIIIYLILIILLVLEDMIKIWLTLNRPQCVKLLNQVDNYNSIVHVDDIDGASRPPFPTNSVQGSKFSNPATYNQMYMQHSYLYDGINDNAGDRIAEILPAQTSARTALTNFKIEITVPGRTDIEAGVVVKYNYPDASPRDTADAAKERNDNLYSGYYLVTAVRHKITHLRHIMILELVKDSLRLERL
jgi:hypothetical protein